MLRRIGRPYRKSTSDQGALCEIYETVIRNKISMKYFVCFLYLSCVMHVWSCLSVQAQSQTAQDEHNKEIVRLYVEGLWNDLQYDLIEQVLAEDVVAHAADGTQEHGRERFREVIPMLRKSFPDLYLDIEEMIAEGDRVALRLRVNGTHLGEAFGYGPTGKKNRHSRMVLYADLGWENRRILVSEGSCYAFWPTGSTMSR